MKKLLKHLIPFLTVLVIAVSSSAVTMQDGSPKMQGSGVPSTLSFPDSLVARLDATINASYPGNGDDWLDVDGISAYAFFLGEDATTSGLEPTFLGTAANSDAAFLFDGADQTRLKVNTAFINRIHKTDETSLGVTFTLAFYWPTNLKSGAITLFGTADAVTDHGFQLSYNNTGAVWTFNQAGNAGSYSVTNVASGVVPEKGMFNYLTFSILKTSGTGGTYRFKLNNDTVLTGSLTVFNASTTSPTDKFQFSGVGVTNEYPIEMKLKGAAIFNESLTASQENTVKSLLQTAYGESFPGPSESVRHFMWNSKNDLLLGNNDFLDVTSENFFNNDQGFMVVRYLAPASFVSHNYLVSANDGTIGEFVGLRVSSFGGVSSVIQASSVAKHNANLTQDILINSKLQSAAVSWKTGESTIISGGTQKTATYSGDPAGMDTINFGARDANQNPLDISIFDVKIGNTYKTKAELQQYLFIDGDIRVAGGGQSLMSGLFSSSDTNSFQGKQNLRIAVHAGIPEKNTVVFVDGSTSGSGAVPSSDPDYWWDDTLDIPGPILIDFKAGMDASGFVPNVMVWSQGETDANFIPSTTPRATYKSAIKSVFDNIRATYGAMPVIIQILGAKTSAHSNTGGYQEVRDIQFELIAENSWIHRGPDSFDQTLTDGIHLVDAGYETMGTRLGNRVLDVFGYTVASAVGPSIASASRSTTTVTVNLTHDSGTDFTPTTGIEGFVFFDDSSEISISAAVRTNATTITLTLASAPTGVETLYYIHDTASAVTLANVVKDNAALSMPLQSTKIILP